MFHLLAAIVFGEHKLGIQQLPDKPDHDRVFAGEAVIGTGIRRPGKAGPTSARWPLRRTYAADSIPRLTDERARSNSD